MMMQDQDSKSQSDEKSSNGSLVTFICVLHWLYIKVDLKRIATMTVKCLEGPNGEIIEFLLRNNQPD
jgi:hypothetical protein